MNSKLEEFFQNLDNKNKLFLYLSVVIVAIILYYNLNYNYFSKQININNKKIQNLNRRNKINIKRYRNKAIKLKTEFKKLNFIVNENLRDLQYLNERLNLSILSINDNKFYSLLENILFKSSNLNLSPTFTISQDNSKFKIYSIDINGSISYCNDKNLFSFIKYLESRKLVNNISNFYFNKKTSKFYIKYNVWGIK